MGLVAVSGGAVSALAVIPAGTAFSPLPPHIAAITLTDADGDGDNDLGTVVDTFA